jgi:uncharacterized DUF497 family protein
VATVRIGEFEWDTEKATRNARKHGVTFVEAMRAFEDPNALTAPDRDMPGRFVLIGLSPRLRLLFVVSVDSGERIRLISARRASPRQRKLYSHGP